MTALYNEIDRFAAEWMRQLVDMNAIAPGDVEDCSVEDLEPARLIQYTQCHFFAGIGAWSYALRLAGWPDDQPVWTASLPCQPFSIAGARRGTRSLRSALLKGYGNSIVAPLAAEFIRSVVEVVQ